MARIKGQMITCDVCGAQQFLDESYNTEAKINAAGFRLAGHTSGVIRTLCSDCYKIWDSWNKNFLKVVDVEEESNVD